MGRSAEKDLTPSERIALLSDSWASVAIGEQQIGDYLALAEGLQADRTRAVLAQLTLKLEFISNYLVSDADRAGYEQWVRRLLTPAAGELGWRPKPGESDETKSSRARVMYTLGYAGKDPAVIADARRLTEKALQDPTSIDPTVAVAAFSLAAQNGDAGPVREADGQASSQGYESGSLLPVFPDAVQISRPEAVKAHAGLRDFAGGSQPGYAGVDCCGDEESSRRKTRLGIRAQPLAGDRQGRRRIH